VSVFTFAFTVGNVRAQGEAISINADGSVSPPSAPISTIDNVTYAFTGNVSDPVYDGIIVERSNIIIDGAGFTVQGVNNTEVDGIGLASVSNVTVMNTNVEDFYWGIGLESSTNSTVSWNNVTANQYEGIVLDNSSNNVISHNNVTANGFIDLLPPNNFTAPTGEGIDIGNGSGNTVQDNEVTADQEIGICIFSSNNSILGNNITANEQGITLNGGVSPCLGNLIKGNYIAANGDGILLGSYINDNTIIENDVVANSAGILIFSLSGGNLLYHNNFIDNSEQAGIPLNCMNSWDDGYPSGGNFWSDYNGTDHYSGPYQDVSGSDGIGDTPYVLDVNNTDYYPLMYPWPQHDVAVTSVVEAPPVKTIIGRGYDINVTVAVADTGNFPETFNLTFYANTTLIASQNITLSNGGLANVTFTWDTTGFAYGNYTISAYAWPVQGETDTANNNCTGGWVIVSLVGDLTGPNGWPDGKVDIRDIHFIASLYGTTLLSPNWNPNADLNGDGKVDIKDVHIAAANYGQHYP